ALTFWLFQRYRHQPDQLHGHLSHTSYPATYMSQDQYQHGVHVPSGSVPTGSVPTTPPSQHMFPTQHSSQEYSEILSEDGRGNGQVRQSRHYSGPTMPEMAGSQPFSSGK